MLQHVFTFCYGDIQQKLADHISQKNRMVNAFASYCSPSMDAMYHTIFVTGASMHVLELFEDRLYAVYGLRTYRQDADARVFARKAAIMPDM